MSPFGTVTSDNSARETEITVRVGDLGGPQADDLGVMASPATGRVQWKRERGEVENEER